MKYRRQDVRRSGNDKVHGQKRLVKVSKKAGATQGMVLADSSSSEIDNSKVSAQAFPHKNVQQMSSYRLCQCMQLVIRLKNSLTRLETRIPSPTTSLGLTHTASHRFTILPSPPCFRFFLTLMGRKKMMRPGGYMFSARPFLSCAK